MITDRVIVGIVVYNTPEEVLAETHASLEGSHLALTVVIYCNADEADYQRRVEVLAQRHACIVLANQPNHGFGAGHNAIIRQSKCEWYVCCNPDIVIEPSCIAELVRFGESHPEAGLIAPKVLNKDGTIQYLSRQHLSLPSWLRRQLWRVSRGLFRPYEVTFDYTATQRLEFVSGCFFLARRRLLEELGGFDEHFFLYGEDADLSRRAERLGPNYFVAEAVVYHGWARAWKSSLSALKHEFICLWKYFRKHGITLNLKAP